MPITKDFNKTIKEAVSYSIKSQFSLKNGVKNMPGNVLSYNLKCAVCTAEGHK